ncbi:MAG TPA: PadR family transcriptional regulator [Myxococcales bacterium]|nr:PadR family transcriptional regulator [Myxococcales bacterium]HIL80926.1 PadR family transcriptional regulator [Myxococcales bacterium]
MPLRHTLLGLLQERPMHGYLLRKRAQNYSWIYPMTNASIYPALHALEEDGFISHESEIQNGRARKIYSITESGRHKLEGWLVASVQRMPCFRDPMLLKIAMQNDDSLRCAREWISAALKNLRGEIIKYQSNMSKIVSAGRGETIGMQLAYEYGFEMLRLRVRLFENLLALTSDPERVATVAFQEHESNDQVAVL